MWQGAKCLSLLVLACLISPARAADLETLDGFIDTKGFAQIVDPGLPGGQLSQLTELLCELTPGFGIDCPGDATATTGLINLYAFAWSGGDVVFDAEFPLAVMVEARGLAESRTGSEARMDAMTATLRPLVPGIPAIPARKGLFFVIVPDVGSEEQDGDPVEVSYRWMAIAYATSGGFGAIDGGGIDNPTITLNQLPPVPDAPDRAKIVFEATGDEVGPDESLDLVEEGAFRARIGDVVGVFLGVEGTLDRTGLVGNPGNAGAMQSVALSVPEPSFGAQGLAALGFVSWLAWRRQRVRYGST